MRSGRAGDGAAFCDELSREGLPRKPVLLVVSNGSEKRPSDYLVADDPRAAGASASQRYSAIAYCEEAERARGPGTTIQLE